ncbi:hypothetical protein [Nannocystis pusilla]|uniref:hypothetical protein n=1 Tax=Nannocystis pusilla TaxID=889268 RepID=UPI003B761C27
MPVAPALRWVHRPPPGAPITTVTVLRFPPGQRLWAFQQMGRARARWPPPRASRSGACAAAAAASASPPGRTCRATPWSRPGLRSMSWRTSSPAARCSPTTARMPARRGRSRC